MGASTDGVEAVRAAIDRAGLGAGASVSRIPMGMSNAVFDVGLADGGRVIARVASVAKNRYAMEEQVMARARAAGIPCPAVFGVETVGDLAVMLIEHIPGVRLAEAPGAAGLVGECAEILGRIHSIDVTGFGNLDDTGRGEGGSLEHWFVDGFGSKFEEARSVDAATGAAVDRIWSTFDTARPLLRQANSALTHGDFSPSNILVENGRISGVVDWESAKAGPPAFDFGWWDWFEAAFSVPFSSDELVAAYAANRPVSLDELRELRRLVVLRILVGQVAWTASRGQESELQTALARLRQSGA